MCYEQSSGKLIDTSTECGPAVKGYSVACIRDESGNIQESLPEVISSLRLEATVFHSTWVRRNGIQYQSNNAYLNTGSNGLDPVFSRVDELMMIGGDMIIFVVSIFKVLYFDSHYHAYVINVTSVRPLLTKCCRSHCSSCSQPGGWIYMYLHIIETPFSVMSISTNCFWNNLDYSTCNPVELFFPCLQVYICYYTVVSVTGYLKFFLWLFFFTSVLILTHFGCDNPS